MKDQKTGIIILAAGSSSRLGQAKQLLKYEGKSLLQITLDAAKESHAGHKILVLGANYQEIESHLDTSGTEVLVNSNWENGMTSSLQLGLYFSTQIDDIEQIVVLLSDQPFVDSNLIDQLIQTQKSTQKGIVASHYANVNGVPVLFTKNYFSKIKQLKEQEGAKILLEKHGDDVASVDFPLGKIDIDTKGDYLDLIS